MKDTPVSFQTVLVPLDGSPLAEKAIPFALDFAKRYAAKLLLFRVRAVPPAIWDAQEIPAVDALQQHEKKACEEYLSKLTAGLGDQGIEIHSEHLAGNPAETVIERAEDLPGAVIVMTSHGRDGIQRWLMGSVAEKVARHATCPVLIVRGGEEK